LRTSLKAATRGWFEHLQDVTSKLGPVNEGELAASMGEAPSRETIEFLAYAMAATKQELARDPMFAAAMDAEAEEPGRDGALELKIRSLELYRRGDLLGAIHLLREAAARDPLSAEIHFRLGCCLWQIGDVAAGLTELEIAVQLQPRWDRARVEIAIVLLNEGRADEARARLLEGRAALDAPSQWLLLHLAHACERTGHPADAIRTYEELLAIEPDNAEALDRLAHLYFVAKDRRKGADAAKRAAQLGIPTVFRAWEEGYYAKGTPGERPRHVGLDALIQFHDGPPRRERE
jgi:Flp pilus assembly protein TadD